MSRRAVKRPDEAAMQRVLERERGTVSGVILRLAWQAGLSRDEIRGLEWRHIDLEGQMVRLEDRSIPMEAEVAEALARRAGQRRGVSPYVIAGSRGAGQMEPQSISRLVRTALNSEESLRAISLKDLRHDFIVRQLERHPWPYVARISGMASTTMYTMFSNYMREEPVGEAEPFRPDEFFLWQLVQAEGPTPVSLALWLVWHQGLDATEVIALTWEQVELPAGVIRLPDRTVELDARLMKWLRTLEAERLPEDDPHVLLTPKSRRPYDLPRLSKAVRTVFIRQGAEQLTLQDFVHAARRNDGDSRLLRLMAEQGPVTRGSAADLLGTTPAAAYGRLRRLTESGSVVRVGGRYYLVGTVVPPEGQYEAIRTYLEELGVAYLQALADVLKIERRSCAWLLKRFVAEGKLARRGQMYVLPASKSEEEQV